MYKCTLYGHDWDDWKEYSINRIRGIKQKMESRMCRRCPKIEERIMPPLEERIVNILLSDITREEMNRRLDNLEDSYGYQLFIQSVLFLARRKFRVPHREPRYITKQRLIFFYLQHQHELLTVLAERAKLMAKQVHL
jgi:hypothetical protein